MIATFINAIAVVIGCFVGLLLKKKITPQFKQIVMLSAGIITLILAIDMAVESPNVLIMLFAIIIGGFTGYALKIEDRILSLGNKLDKGEGSDGSFGKGFLNASLLFCSGAMSIVGSINAGTTGEMDLILIKSVMDGFMAVVFAANYGIGVMLAAVSIIIYQGFFTLSASLLAPVLGDIGIQAIASTGGALLIMIALNLLELKEVKTGNFLPALLYAPLMQIGLQLLTN